MIPTLILLGAIAGLLPRAWWFVAVAAVGWPALLVLTGATTNDPLGSAVLLAAAVGAANTAVGVAFSRGVRWTFRQLAAPV